VIQIVTFNRRPDKRNNFTGIFPSCGFDLRRKNDLEASALQPIKHRAFAYAIGVNWIHAAGKRPPLIDAASVSVPGEEGTDLISELIQGDLKAVPGQRKEMDVYASASRKSLETTLLIRRYSHPESLTDKMPAAFAALDATPQRDLFHLFTFPKPISPRGFFVNFFASLLNLSNRPAKAYQPR